MLLIILTAILASILFAGCNVRNYYLRERKATVAPCMPQTPIPKSHKLLYILDWVILLAIIAALVVYICNAI